MVWATGEPGQPHLGLLLPAQVTGAPALCAALSVFFLAWGAWIEISGQWWHSAHSPAGADVREAGLGAGWGLAQEQGAFATEAFCGAGGSKQALLSCLFPPGSALLLSLQRLWAAFSVQVSPLWGPQHHGSIASGLGAGFLLHRELLGGRARRLHLRVLSPRSSSLRSP